MGDATGLSEEQRRALDQLSKLPIMADFYLAGGTALGIRLGHRRSVDLDFFSRTPIADLDATKSALESSFERVEVRAQTDVALHLLCDGLPIDFVRYPYPPLDPPTEALGVGLAQLRDLAVMKLAAISRRGIRRDFWDLREALGTGLTLRECGAAYVMRFGVREADLYHVLRALTYFDDADKESAYPRGLDAAMWDAIKTFFRREAPKLIGDKTRGA
jgi:Nucleotidyl transferase AbiEii toxin, Type IV TA system